MTGMWIFKNICRMKRINSLMVCVTALAALASCERSEVAPQEPENGYRYTFSIVDDNTKATLDNEGVAWEANDRVGMFVDTYKGYANVDVTTTPKSIVLYSPSAIPAGAMAYGYYPYNNTNTNAEMTLINLSNVQQGGTNAAMPMAGVPFEVETDVPTVTENGKTKAETNGQIQFLNLGAIIDFKIYSADYSDETVKYVTFKAENAVVAGDAYLDITAVSATDESTLELVWMGGENEYDEVKVNQEVAVAATKDDATSIYMVVAPGTYSGTITIGTDVATYTFNYTNKELGRNKLKHYNMNLSSSNANRVEEVVEVVKSLPYTESFTSNIGEFETDGVQVASTNVWTWGGASYGMKASARVNGTNYAAESWLTSPWIDLSSVSAAAVTFDHVHQYAGTASNELTFWVLTDESDATWQQVTIPKYAAGNNWTFVNSGEIILNSYVGHKVKIGFKYISTTSKSATWEIKNFSAYILKSDPELSFETTDFEAEIGAEFTAPTLVNPHGLTVTYSSDNEDIAAVDENTGEVLIGDVEGTVTITASFAGNDAYNAGSASYTISVIDPSAVIEKGATWTYTFTANQFSDDNKTVTLAEQDWTMAGIGGPYFGYDGTKGQQFGSGSKPYSAITLTSNFGRLYGVESIAINASGANSIEATLSVKVNGVSYKCDNSETVSLTNTATTYTFNTPDGLNAGDIVISIANTSSKAVYVKAITVNPEGTIVDPVKLEMSDITCTNSGENENTLSFSWTAVENALGYQVSEDGGTTYGSTQTALTYTLAGLSAGTTYSIKVKAIGDGTNYLDSEAKTGTGATKSAQTGDDVYSLFSGDLTEGDYIIVYDGGAMKSTVTSSRLDYSEVTITNDAITGPAANLVWHIAKSGDYWTIYSSDAKAYAAGTGAKNKAQLLSDGTDDKSLWSVTASDDTYDFTNKANAAAEVNASLRRNGTYGFACYATGTGGTLSLYKKN